MDCCLAVWTAVDLAAWMAELWESSVAAHWAALKVGSRADSSASYWAVHLADQKDVPPVGMTVDPMADVMAGSMEHRRADGLAVQWVSLAVAMRAVVRAGRWADWWVQQ